MSGVAAKGPGVVVRTEYDGPGSNQPVQASTHSHVLTIGQKRIPFHSLRERERPALIRRYLPGFLGPLPGFQAHLAAPCPFGADYGLFYARLNPERTSYRARDNRPGGRTGHLGDPTILSRHGKVLGSSAGGRTGH